MCRSIIRHKTMLHKLFVINWKSGEGKKLNLLIVKALEILWDSWMRKANAAIQETSRLKSFDKMSLIALWRWCCAFGMSHKLKSAQLWEKSMWQNYSLRLSSRLIASTSLICQIGENKFRKFCFSFAHPSSDITRKRKVSQKWQFFWNNFQFRLINFDFRAT